MSRIRPWRSVSSFLRKLVEDSDFRVRSLIPLSMLLREIAVT